jgi:hypothetical protein
MAKLKINFWGIFIGSSKQRLSYPERQSQMGNVINQVILLFHGASAYALVSQAGADVCQ